MAYNPFMMFRKNQKVIMAGLVIFTMVIFVVSSGAGGADLFNQFTDWVTGRSGRSGSGVASLDGKTIEGQAVEMTRQKRRMASTYIELLNSFSYDHILRNAVEQRDKLDPNVKRLVDQLIELQRRGERMPFDQLPQFLSEMGRLRRAFSESRLLLELSTATNKAEQTRIAEDLTLMLDRQIARLSRQYYRPKDSYFGGEMDSVDDVLTFMMWKNEADHLGVQFGKPEVSEAIRLESLNQRLSREEAAQLDQVMRRTFQGVYSPDRLNDALLDEFRVRAAKSAITGESAHGRSSPPIVATPDELFEWFEDVQTSVRVGLIDVPVASYLSKVTGQPSEQQLKELFEKFKAEEADPRLERPGFKEPRLMKVEWFEIPLESEYYQNLAKKAEPVLSAMRQFGLAVSGDGTPALPWSIVLVASPAVANAPLVAAYQDFVNNSPSWRDSLAWGVRSGIHDSSVLRAENIASLLSATAGARMTGAGPLSAILTFEGKAVGREIKDRARVGATTILSAIAEPAPFGIDALLMNLTPPATSEKALAKMLAEQERNRLALRLMNADVETFRAEVTKRAKEQDANNVAAFINDFIHTRGFARGGTTKPVDRFAITDDPGMSGLRKAFSKLFALMPGGGADPNGEVFSFYTFGEPGAVQKPELFQILPVRTDSSMYWFWRSETVDPKQITFEQAKPKIESAWKMEKARELAKKDAERIAAEAAAKKGDVQQLRDLAMQTSPRGLIELSPMAKLNKKENLATGGSPTYQQPQVPQDKVAYPGDMAAKIVDLRKQAVGATEVLSDQGKANYYIAALLGKDVPTQTQFAIAYKNSMAPAAVRDGLFDIFTGERLNRYGQEIVKQLKSENRLEIFKDTKKEQPQSE